MKKFNLKKKRTGEIGIAKSLEFQFKSNQVIKFWPLFG